MSREIIEKLFERASEVTEPGHVGGSVQFLFPGQANLDCSVNIGDSGLCFSWGKTENADATVTLPVEKIQQFYTNPTDLEPRKLEYADGICATGEITLIHYVTQLLKRPTEEIAERIEYIRTNPEYGAKGEIAVIDRPNEEEIKNHIRAGQPLLATGLLQDAEFLNWNLETLRDEFGHLPLRKGKDGTLETLGEFTDRQASEGAERVYTNGCLLPDEMKKHFELPFIRDGEFTPEQIWLGKKREGKPITRLHCDFVHSILTQVWGRKRFLLYSPEQHEYLYPYKSYNIYQPCRVDPYHASWETHYPDFKYAEPLELVVGPGDMLILPAGWFHCVFALDDVFSVGRFLKWQSI